MSRENNGIETNLAIPKVSCKVIGAVPELDSQNLVHYWQKLDFPDPFI